jgi:transposase
VHLKITKVNRKGKVYQYAQLVEAYRREDGMATQRVVANLGARTDLEIANLRAALQASRGGRAVVLAEPKDPPVGFEVLDNLAWADVAVVIEVLRSLGVDRLLEEVLPREEAEVPDADVVMALVAQRCVAPDSKRSAVEWFGETGLPELLGLPLSRFNNTRVHRVLEGLEAAEEALQERLAAAMHARRGSFSLLFMDLTDTWFVGRGPSLATFGKTKEGLLRRKVGIALLCDELGHPLQWSVVEGRRHDSGPMKELAWKLQALPWARGVPLVLDRAMGATAHLEELLSTGQPFITALSRNEFDAYTDRVPGSALAEVAWNAPDAARLAAEAVQGAGMQRVRDDLYVLDLGVVTREQGRGAVVRPLVDGSDKCRDRMAMALAMQAALDSGRATTQTDAAAPFGLSVFLASKTLRLLRLAPDLQRAIADGEADSLTIRTLLDLTRTEDHDAQRTQFQAALDAARTQPDGRRARKTGSLRAAPPRPDVLPPAPALRAVVAFNPEQWIRQRENIDQLLGEIRAWTRRKNEALRGPGSKTSAAKLRQEATARLARHHLVEACDVTITTQHVDGRDVLQVQIEPQPDAWTSRQRFFGFQVIVANPTDGRSAADLVAVYRSKDGVEKDFQTIKSVLCLRPVRHRTDTKVRAHVTLCMLALLVERVLDQAMQRQATGAAALDALADIRLNRIKTPAHALPVYTITRPKADHLAILRALDLTRLLDDAEVTASLYPR